MIYLLRWICKQWKTGLERTLLLALKINFLEPCLPACWLRPSSHSTRTLVAFLRPQQCATAAVLHNSNACPVQSFANFSCHPEHQTCPVQNLVIVSNYPNLETVPHMWRDSHLNHTLRHRIFQIFHVQIFLTTLSFLLDRMYPLLGSNSPKMSPYFSFHTSIL